MNLDQNESKYTCFFLVLGLVLFIFNPKISDASSNFLQNNASNTSKIEPKVLNVLQIADNTGGNFHTVVDVTLENQSYIEIVCSISSYDNKTQTDYTLFPHNDLNLTFDDALQSDRCLSEDGR